VTFCFPLYCSLSQQLSQFWYSEETTRALVDVSLAVLPRGGRIGFISCPTAYRELRRRKLDVSGLALLQLLNISLEQFEDERFLHKTKFFVKMSCHKTKFKIYFLKTKSIMRTIVFLERKLFNKEKTKFSIKLSFS
jgi:hypothetical protein